VDLKRTILAATAAIALSAPASAAGQTPEPQTPTVPTIVTTGEAVVRRAPDQAFISVAVETRARNPRDAQQQNAQAMTAVQEKLAAAGLPKDAVRTIGYRVQQEFDYPNGRRVPREYVARNGIEVRLDAIERTGEILDAVVQAGATMVTGVRFDLKERGAVEREALKLAVEDARARAEALAAGAGRSIVRVLKIDDTREPVVPFRQMEMSMRAAAADAAPTPIEAGPIEVRASVQLTVAMQ
jgi:hypothetical protein